MSYVADDLQLNSLIHRDNYSPVHLVMSSIQQFAAFLCMRGGAFLRVVRQVWECGGRKSPSGVQRRSTLGVLGTELPRNWSILV